MVSINILTNQLPWRKRGFNDFYPLLKWHKEFSKKNIRFSFFDSHLKRDLVKCDVLILDFRYYEQILKGHKTSPDGRIHKNESFIIEFIQKVKKLDIRIILFDTGDSGGSVAFPLTPYVDVHLKKQLFKDKSIYTNQSLEHRNMIWLPDTINDLPHLKEKSICRPEDLNKLKVGWNIGMCDYRYFPNWFRKYTPVGNSMLLNNIYKMPKTNSVNHQKRILLSYRGSLKTTDNARRRYNYSRELLLNKLRSCTRSDIIIGGKIGYKEYVNEMKNSFIGISPFGWGEVCYRDFEIILNSSILLKPSMEHLITFPNLYISNETYVPVEWDYSNLIQIIEDIESDKLKYELIAKSAQDLYMNYVNNSEQFINHFKNSLDI